MQPHDGYEKQFQGGPRVPGNARGDAAQEFVARLDAYARHAGNLTNPGTLQDAVRRVVAGMTDPDQKWNAHRQTLATTVEPLIKDILEMEHRWLCNVAKAQTSAEQHLDENKAAFETHSGELTDLEAADRNLEWLLSQRRTVQGWSISVAKGKALIKLDEKLNTANARVRQSTQAIQQRFGPGYFDGLRLYLRGAGFVVAPTYLPPAAVFPREDWIEGDRQTYEQLSVAADLLIKKYRLLGTPYTGLLYCYGKLQEQTTCGCLCVSWVVTKTLTDQKAVYVPVLGLSGGAPSSRNRDGVEAMLGACALPPYTTLVRGAFGTAALSQIKQANETLFNQYYDDIMSRANNLAVNYRVREALELRLPSRQAMLAYLGFSFFVPTRQQVTELSSEIEPTPGVTRWHSFNCAEPAALAWISSFFADGQDVHLCCPYEGMDDPGHWGLKPKETCPWCATVEIAYRSLLKVLPEETRGWTGRYDRSMTTGEWAREITHAERFSGLVPDQQWREALPRNKSTFEEAYPPAVNGNVGVLRALFHEVGLLNEETIRVGRDPLWQQ